MKRLLCIFLCLTLCLLSAATVFAAGEENTVTVEKDILLSALYEADISSVREALSLGLVTSQELTAYYLDRIDQYNKPYNCFITICDNAMEIAKQRDDAIKKGEGEGLLFGVPVVIKDNMDLAGYHTTNGYKKTDEQIADSNADVVQALLDAGAVVIAKANMSTAAQDAIRSHSKAVGETKNAYNSAMAAGGSSGGTAVSVSLNFAMAGLGTDTNSSLRIPAALAGCISLRPTFGLLSKEGIVKLNSSRDTAGAITRTVLDQAIMLDVLTGGDKQYTDNLNSDALKGMRIGVLKQLSYATGKNGRTEENIDTEVAEAFQNAIEELKACGAEVVTVSMSKLFSLSDPTFKSGKQELKDSLYAEFQKILNEYQVSAVIYPSYLSTPIRSGKDADGKYWNPYSQTNINNCRTLSPSASIPEISVPIGIHSLGAGIGMEIAAPRNCEQLLLDIAYSYTKKYDHRALPEGAPDAYQQSNAGTLEEVIADYKYRLEELNKPEETVSQTQEQTVPQQTPPQEKQDDRENNMAYWVIPIVVVITIVLLLIILRVRKKKKARARKKRAFAAINEGPGD